MLGFLLLLVEEILHFIPSEESVGKEEEEGESNQLCKNWDTRKASEAAGENREEPSDLMREWSS